MAAREINRISKIMLLVALGCYLIALYLHPYSTNNPSSSLSGFYILFFGWGGVLLSKANLAWFANPALLLSVLLIKQHPKTSVVLAALAVGLGLDCLRFYSFGFDSNRDIYAGTVTGIEAGAYVWLFSLILVLIAQLIQISFRAEKKG